MNRIDRLVQRYQRFVRLPWDDRLAGAERIWFLVYDQADERRVRARIDAFELATRRAGHGWRLCELTDSFPRWMAAQDYRESYFEDPEALELLLPDYHERVVEQLRSALQTADADTVVAVLGIAGLFGFIRASSVLDDPRVKAAIRGRLLVFFPGEHLDNNYRLLGARDGWNYMAVPIIADG